MDEQQYAQWLNTMVFQSCSAAFLYRDFLAISKTAMILLVNDSGNAYRFLDMLLKHIRALSKHLSDNRLIQDLLSSRPALTTRKTVCVYIASLCICDANYLS